MNRKVCAIGMVVLIVVAVGVLFILGMEPEDPPFDSEGRYDSTVFNNMGVIYSNRSHIEHWNNGYSESDVCPWGAEHNGLDYMFQNNSPVIAAAPGLVENIEIGYLPNSSVYAVGVQIRFNDKVWLNYAFEGNANESVRTQQIAMIDVQLGDWVAKGDQIGRFLRPVVYDHIHFSVYVNEEAVCPRSVMGEDDYNDIMILVHSFHPTWELCYP
jgi:murein DD-endopeptidase MepM/ murein hydrolase activator NlpD